MTHPSLPALPVASSIDMQQRPADDCSNLQPSLVLTLPPAGLLLYRRALICLIIVLGMSSIPILGVWYFFGYKGLMPGPQTAYVETADETPAAGGAEMTDETAQPESSAGAVTNQVARPNPESNPAMPNWYPLMMAVSLSFISLIFLFAAWVFAVEGLHAIFGHTKLIVSPDGINLHRPLWGFRIHVGERALPTDTITDIASRPDTDNGFGSVRISAAGYRYDVGEQLRQKDRDWLADVLRLTTGTGGPATQGSMSDSASSSVRTGSSVSPS